METAEEWLERIGRSLGFAHLKQYREAWPDFHYIIDWQARLKWRVKPV